MIWIALVTLLACSSTSGIEERAAAPTPSGPSTAAESTRASPEELEPPAAPRSEAPATLPPTQTGDLTVDVNHGWGEVWLDGERVTDETPLNAWTTSVGRHQLRVVQPETRDVLLDIEVEVHLDEMTIVHLDANDRTHRIERFGDDATETAAAAIVSAPDGTTCLAPGSTFVTDGEVNVGLRGPRGRQQQATVATDTMTVSMGAARRRPPTGALRLTDALYRSGDIYVVSADGHLEIRNDGGVLARTPLTMPRWDHPLTTVDEPCIAMGISDDVVLTSPDSPWAVVALQHSIPDVCEVRNPLPRCSVVVIRLGAP